MKLHFGLCKKCGKEYSRTRPLRGEFCSRECTDAFRFISNCKYCNKDFEFGLRRQKTIIVNDSIVSREDICADCVALLYHKLYYKDNKSTLNLQNSLYRKNNIDEIRAYFRKYK